MQGQEYGLECGEVHSRLAKAGRSPRPATRHTVNLQRDPQPHGGAVWQSDAEAYACVKTMKKLSSRKEKGKNKRCKTDAVLLL